MNMRLFCFSITMICLVLFGCEKEAKTVIKNGSRPDSMAVILNNKAVKILSETSDYNETGKNDDLYDSALKLLNLAIAKDPTYLWAYENKVLIERRQGRLSTALNTARKMEIINPNSPNIKIGIGIILDKLDSTEKAAHMYRIAIKLLKERINASDSSYNDQVNLAYLYLLTGDESQAFTELQEMRIKYPDNYELQMMERIFTEFNKEEFIKDF